MHGRLVAAGVAALLILGGATATAAVVPPQGATDPTDPTIVTLTFDDGFASHPAVVTPMLQRAGLYGTFYVPSGISDATREQLLWMQATGQEIGGHTVDHQRLEGMSEDEQRAEICDDRQTLRRAGLKPVISFAYPFGVSGGSEDVVRDCGYTSGRLVGGIRGPDCPECQPSEDVPPRNVFRTGTPISATQATTLAQLQGFVEQAAGWEPQPWVPLVFHDVCDGASCDPDVSVRRQVLQDFVTWLRAEQDAGRVIVQRMGDVLGGGRLPLPPAPGTA